MPKLYSLTKADAQGRCDDVHARLIAASPQYAGEVQRHETVKWADPAQDMSSPPMGQAAVPVNALWYCPVTERCWGVLTPSEKAGAVADGTDPLSITVANVVAFVRQITP